MTVVLLVFTALAAVAMILALRRDAAYAFAPTSARDVGDLTTVDPSTLVENQYIRAQAMLGSVLSIKPIIDISDGSVHEAGKVRTRRKALIWMRDRIFAEPHISRTGDGLLLALHQSERGAARAYLWRIDDPCGPAPAG